MRTSIRTALPVYQPPSPCCHQRSRCLLTVQVRTGLGSLPADFDAALKGRALPTAASNLTHWEAYAAAHMFDPSTAKL